MSSRNVPILACLAILWPIMAAGSDVDGDGVDGAIDICPNTPPGILVDAEGRPLGNLDGDCDVDLEDGSILQTSPSALDDLALYAGNMTGPLRCSIPVSANDIELRYALRWQAGEESTSCTLPSSRTDYLENGCFVLEIYAADTRPQPLGITCVYFDVTLGDAGCPFAGTQLTVADAWPDFRSGTIASAGLVDEVGGCTLEPGLGVAEWVLVATIDVAVAQDACTAEIILTGADTASSLFGAGGPATVGFGQPFDINVRCSGVIYDIWPAGGDGFIDGSDRSVFRPCLGEIAPFSENCEGLDWNCDGAIDAIDQSFLNAIDDRGVCAGRIEVPPCQLGCQ